jgi:hypothetical protein
VFGNHSAETMLYSVLNAFVIYFRMFRDAPDRFVVRRLLSKFFLVVLIILTSSQLMMIFGDSELDILTSGIEACFRTLGVVNWRFSSIFN